MTPTQVQAWACGRCCKPYPHTSIGKANAEACCADAASDDACAVAEPCLLAKHAPAVYQRIVAGQGAAVVADVLRGAPALPQAFMAARARQRRAG